MSRTRNDCAGEIFGGGRKGIAMDADTEAKVLAIAKRVSLGYARRIHVDHQELLGASWEGAKEAADKWDETKSVHISWAAFVGWRAQVRIIDYLRTLLPSSAKRNQELRNITLSIHGARDEFGEEIDFIVQRGPSHESEVDTADFRQVLGTRGGIIIGMRLQGYSLKEIAADLGISESRTSQLLHNLMQQFKADRRMIDLLGWEGEPAARSCRQRSG